MSTEIRHQDSISTDPGQCESRVLIVEDDPTQLYIIERVIREARLEGFIEWTSNGEEALNLLKSNDYDLVIADVALGNGMTGVELWREEQQRHPDLPFLFISGLGYDSFLKGIGTDEASPSFLNKPIFIGEAAQVIGHFLTNRKDKRLKRQKVNLL